MIPSPFYLLQVQHRLIDQNLISAGIPLVGGGLLGFATGFAIRKIMKFAFIGLGLLVLVLAFLQYKHWISVNWTVTENQSSAILTHIANKIATVTQHMNHEIPIGVGVLGFMPGLVLGLYKGLEMKFLHLFNKSFSTSAGFTKIQGYEDIKDIVLR